MSITIGHLQPVVAIIAGILILLMPRLLNYIVAIYLIVFGIIGLGIFKEPPAPSARHKPAVSGFYFNNLPALASPARDLSFEAPRCKLN